MLELQSDFQCFQLTQDELKEARFNRTQRRFLQNLLGEVAHEKINQTIDTQDVTKYIQLEAYLHGKLDVLRFLLSTPEFSHIKED